MVISNEERWAIFDEACRLIKKIRRELAVVERRLQEERARLELARKVLSRGFPATGTLFTFMTEIC